MAMIWAESFDLFGTDKSLLASSGYSNTPGTNAVLTTTNPRTGLASLQFTSTNFTWLDRVLDVPVSTLIVGVAVRVNVAPNHVNWGFSSTTSGGTWRIVVNPNLGISVYNTRNAGGTLLGASANNLFTLSSWQYLEFKITATSVEVHLEGNLVLLITGQTFGTFSNLVMGSPISTGANTTNFQIDDLYVCDDAGPDNNDFLGNRRCVALLPDADEALQQWTPSSGPDGYAMIDEVPANDADYVEAFTAGDISEFSKQALTINTNNIAAVMLMARSLKTDAGTSSYRMGINSNGNIENSQEFFPGTSFAYARAFFEKNPDGGIPWTQNELDNATIRLTRES
jgi:hypothetical protein